MVGFDEGPMEGLLEKVAQLRSKMIRAVAIQRKRILGRRGSKGHNLGMEIILVCLKSSEEIGLAGEL